MKNPRATFTKRGSTLFLRVATLAIGTVVLALCLFALPAAWLAVDNEYSTHTYVFYAILICMYVAAVPFFVGVYQVLRLLSYIDKNKAFSELSVKALRLIAYCGVAISAVYAISLPFFYIWADNDDAPGLIIIAMAFILAPLIITVFSAVLQRLLRQAIDMKRENDLTV
jgi:hypothetical protein